MMNIVAYMWLAVFLCTGIAVLVSCPCLTSCRFAIGVSESLVNYMMPKLRGFEEAAQAAVDAVAQGTSEGEDAALFLNLAQTLRQMMIIAIQDAVVLAEKYPENDFIKRLEEHEEFRCETDLPRSARLSARLYGQQLSESCYRAEDIGDWFLFGSACFAGECDIHLISRKCCLS